MLTKEQEKWLNEVFYYYNLIVDFYEDDPEYIAQCQKQFVEDYSDFDDWKDMYDCGLSPKQALREVMDFWELEEKIH